MKYNRAFISLGSNLGDRYAMVINARSELEKAGIRIIRCTTIHETKPVLVLDQPLFLNQVLEIQTSYSPGDLLNLCKRIEKTMGRTTSVRYGPREIDLDILSYDGIAMDTEELELPHPGIFDRLYLIDLLHEMGETPQSLLEMSENRGILSKL